MHPHSSTILPAGAFGLGSAQGVNKINLVMIILSGCWINRRIKPCIPDLYCSLSGKNNAECD